MKYSNILPVIFATFMLMSMSAYAVPTVTIDSPTATTYDNATIDLNWSADETLGDAYYSLNDASNVSLAEGNLIYTGNWTSDDYILSSMVANAQQSGTVFYYGSQWHLILGGFLYGGLDSTKDALTWDGAVWQLNGSIDNGLYSLIGGRSSAVPETFYWDSQLHMIMGTGDGATRYGFTWNGTIWQTNSSVISGISSSTNSAITVFEKDNVWYAIQGNQAGTFNGYNWTGNTWQSDTAIVNGLSDIGQISTPNVFEMNGYWYLISGESSGNFYGYNWTGTSWQSDTAIIGGLATANIYTSPVIYELNDTMYFLSLDYTGTFKGYNITQSLDYNFINTTITGIEGQNTVVIYATNTSDDMGYSSVSFTVDAILDTGVQSNIDSAKALGELPAGAILGLTENVSVADGIRIGILAVILGFGMFMFTVWSKRG
ncbi:hypothetical protein GQ472_02000 [archaeon]|nr:hypothetical protein [archaeon]